jgi:hypothetical protein
VAAIRLARQRKDVYGLAPVHLFGISRLNQIRKELLTHACHDATIGTLAQKWGINHLGRFAAE